MAAYLLGTPVNRLEYLVIRAHEAISLFPDPLAMSTFRIARAILEEALPDLQLADKPTGYIERVIAEGSRRHDEAISAESNEFCFKRD